MTDDDAAQRYTLKDSGERESWATGSRRDTRTGKGRYDLASPLAMRRLALVLERGAAKYGDRNYELGQPLSRYIDSAMRHLFQVIEGKDDEDHAGQAAWNVLALMHTQEAIRRGLLADELDDLPNYTASPDVEPDGCLDCHAQVLRGAAWTHCGEGPLCWPCCERRALPRDERDDDGLADELVEAIRCARCDVLVDREHARLRSDVRGGLCRECAVTLARADGSSTL